MKNQNKIGEKIMIQYCKRCCLPSTKPHLSFDEEGICNACRNYENRKNVDWDERKKELMEILDRYRSKDGSNWDCIIQCWKGQHLSGYHYVRTWNESTLCNSDNL